MMKHPIRRHITIAKEILRRIGKFVNREGGGMVLDNEGGRR